jgi:LPXTG-site transpeptidase (sortase) family protein
MKKITVYKIILVILVITAIILAGFVIKKQIESKKVEDNTKTVLQEIKKENKSNPEQIDVIQEIDQKIGEYKVIGIINIPKIGIEYPILEKTNKESLELSITKFWGEKINQKGNVVLAGHNRLNNTMFGKIDKLENGDIIELTDSQMVTVKYQVFDKYVIDPNDIDCIFPIEENTREVTLITCTNRDKNRLVVKAREVI